MDRGPVTLGNLRPREREPGSQLSGPFHVCSMQRVLSLLLVCSIGAGAPGCATLRTIPAPGTSSESPSAQLKRGDELVLTLRDGRRVEVEIERIEDNTIVSTEGVRYERSDIVTLQVHRVSAWRTALLVGGIVAGAFVVAGMMIASALNSFWGG